jgi:hypothetical protein
MAVIALGRKLNKLSRKIPLPCHWRFELDQSFQLPLKLLCTKSDVLRAGSRERSRRLTIRNIRRLKSVYLFAAAFSLFAMSSAKAEVINLLCSGSNGGSNNIWVDTDKKLITRQWYVASTMEYHAFPVEITRLAFSWEEGEGWSYRIDRSTGVFAGAGPGGKRVNMLCAKGSAPLPAPKF